MYGYPPHTPLAESLSLSSFSLSRTHTQALSLSCSHLCCKRIWYTEAGEDRHDGGTRVAERAVARLALLAAEVQATKDVPGRGQNPNVGRP
jgi:hypothetical protein